MVMPRIFNSGYANSNIFMISKNKPIIKRQKIKIAKAKTILKAASILFM